MRANVLNLWIFETLDQSRTFENVLELPGTSGTINYNQEVLVWEACNLLWLSLLWDQGQCRFMSGKWQKIPFFVLSVINIEADEHSHPCSYRDISKELLASR